MALSTYTELQTAISDWLKDSSLSAQTDVFIRLIEAQFNRELRTPEMEVLTTLTSATDSTPLPSGFLQMKAIWTGVYPPLSEVSIVELQQRYAPVEVSYRPQAYAIVGSTIYFGLTPIESTDWTVHYFQEIPNLSPDNPTNWLMAANPDVYLWGSLLMAEARGWNDERLPMISDAFSTSMASIQTAGIKKRYGGGPLVPRTGINQPYGARA